MSDNPLLGILALSLLLIGSIGFAENQIELKCNRPWEVAEGVPLISNCPLAIVAYVKNGPNEIRHLSRATVDKCAYEDILSNAGGSNQIVCRIIRR